MSGKISKAESWSTVYKAYQNINFSGYDYESIKRSLIDYIKTYHSENFNDYIENSELIAMIETFAYVGQLLAYRQDMTAHENFMTLATRKQSVLQLAKYISYDANRNLPPRGLVKLNTIETTEEVYDSRGINLANKRIVWNDVNNPNWREQFLIVMNLILEQRYGSVAPADRVQVDDVLFELYQLKNRPVQDGVLRYSTTSGSQTFPLELVPVAFDENGPIERRPAKDAPMSILYGSDGLGDGSPSTGFFMFTKQGNLSKVTKTFDGITPNQSFVIGSPNINDIDVWVNNVDPDTGLTITDRVIDPMGRRLNSSGEWTQVDSANVDNVIYNTNLNRNKFETETLDDDDVRIIFGDGEFADIPSGTFDIWYRTSTAGNSIILQNSVVNRMSSLSYINYQNKAQTFTFTFSLVNSLTNGAATEDIERIRNFAPAVYYTQDRMVNGRDYNNYPLQNQAIEKLRAINRTYAGDSKYLAWHDPSEHYENVKIFGDDLSIYYEIKKRSESSHTAAPLAFIRNTVQPLLSSTYIRLTHAQKFLPSPARDFTTNELGTPNVNDVRTILGEIQQGLLGAQTVFTLYMCYRPIYTVESPTPIDYEWVTFNERDAEVEPGIIDEATFTLVRDKNEGKWEVQYNATVQVAISPTTKFWFNNQGRKTIVSDTLNAELDQIIVLKANGDASNKILKRNIPINVVDNVYYDSDNTNAGLTDSHALSIISQDINGDGVPDDLLNAELFQQVEQLIGFNIDAEHPLPTDFEDVRAHNDELVLILNGRVFYSENSPSVNTGAEKQSLYLFEELNSAKQPAAANEVVAYIRIKIPVPGILTEAREDYNRFRDSAFKRGELIRRKFAYMDKDPNEQTNWIMASLNEVEIRRNAWITGKEDSNDPSIRGGIRKLYGGNGYNFAWFHRTPRYHMVDPSVTNIIDMFVITKGYYKELQDWISGITDIKPTPPTSFELRTTLGQVLGGRMISDAVVMHSGLPKIVFGPKSRPELNATFKVVRAPTATMSSNELKVRIVNVIKNFLHIGNWEFGETFYFTEMNAAIHADLVGEIDSIVLVPTSLTGSFGDMFEIRLRDDEFIIPDIDTNMIEIVEQLDNLTIKSK